MLVLQKTFLHFELVETDKRKALEVRSVYGVHYIFNYHYALN